MTLKNSRRPLLTTIATIAMIFIADFRAALAKEVASSALPVIHYVGVLPVQWEKDDSWTDLDSTRRSISKQFGQAVRESHRFAALNDDLVASMWSSPAGRKELASDYELQAFCALNMSSRGDMVVMTTRLLSPTFDSWLQESEVVPRNWFLESSKEQITGRLGDLIHRMINRLPVDAHVTSVNGEFATISAGSEQSLHVGDEFDVINPKIQTLHPANGSWLTFNASRSGKIRIVEAKGKSSIGKITSLTSDNSISVGHGIRIEAISGRSHFARPDGSETFVNAQSKSGNAIVPAMTPEGKPEPMASGNMPAAKPPAAAPITQPAQATAPVVTSTPEAQASETTAATPAATDAAPASTETPTPAADKPSDNSPTAGVIAIIAPKGSEFEGYAGLKSWSIGGTGSAGAALPLWLINSVGGSINRSLSDAVKVNYGLDLGYGTTAKGSFFGYGIHGSGIYVMKMKLFDGADHAFGGLEARIHSLSVGGETSGGYDMTTLNLLVGMGGNTMSSLIGMRLDWTADLRFAAQESGQFGVNGSMASITGGNGILLDFMGYVGERPKEGYQFGAGVEFGSGNYNLSDSKSATYNIFSILGLARMTL